jgi:hypothetical protein
LTSRGTEPSREDLRKDIFRGSRTHRDIDRDPHEVELVLLTLDKHVTPPLGDTADLIATGRIKQNRFSSRMADFANDLVGATFRTTDAPQVDREAPVNDLARKIL